MRFARLAFLALPLVSLVACGTAVINSSKSGSFTDPIASVKVVYEGVPLDSRAARASVGTLLGAPSTMLEPRDGALTADARALGQQVLNTLPSSLKSVGLATDREPLQVPRRLVSPEDIEAAVGPRTGSGNVMVIRPISAKMECAGGCFAFRVQVSVLGSDYTTRLWSATFDVPPKVSNFADFSGPAASFSDAVAAQLKKDGVVR
jgi:hypothetical protein